MTDNSKNSVVRAFERLRETFDGVPTEGASQAHINSIRADLDALKQELENDGAFAFKEQRSNGSVDKDEPIEHTEAYFDRSNDWLGFAEGGQLTRTVNQDEQKLNEVKREEKQAEETDKRLDAAARGDKADDVSNGPDQRKQR